MGQHSVKYSGDRQEVIQGLLVQASHSAPSSGQGMSLT